MFAALPLLWRLGIAAGGLVAVLGALGALYVHIDHQGYERGYGKATAEWTLKYQQLVDDIDKRTTVETNRQTAANEAAQAEEAAELEADRKRQIAAADRGMTLAAEAAADPNHDNIALDAAAVERHNRRLD